MVSVMIYHCVLCIDLSMYLCVLYFVSDSVCELLVETMFVCFVVPYCHVVG